MSWEKTSAHIVHIDGDAFFASCAQAVHPEYKGKPVVTGQERGIAAAMSYEAKAFGITRGMPIHQIRQLCPQVIVIPNDYESYSLFSKRMFAIMRRYSSLIEEYGIDEGFMDITGLRSPLGMSYEEIARSVKRDIERELNITVSVGLASTKVLAKLGSKTNKPAGFTRITSQNVTEILSDMPIEKIWGIGKNTTGHMRQLGITTAGAFAKYPWGAVCRQFAKPYQDIWQELNGNSVIPLITEQKESYASISKTRTFTPATYDQAIVLSQLLKNLENACVKARNYNLAAKKIIILLKTQAFQTVALEASITRASAFPTDLIPIAQQLFQSLFRAKTYYRSTGVILANLQPNNTIQQSLFEPPVTLEKLTRMYESLDHLAEKYGKHTVHLGGSLLAHAGEQCEGARNQQPWRKTVQLKGENKKQRLRIPLLSHHVL